MDFLTGKKEAQERFLLLKRIGYGSSLRLRISTIHKHLVLGTQGSKTAQLYSKGGI